MMSFLILIVYVALAAAVVWWLASWARSRVNALSAASTFVDEFYDSSKKLIADDSVPRKLIELVQILSHFVGTPKLARTFAWHLIRNHSGLTKVNKAKSGDIRAIINALSASQKTILESCIVNAMLSSAACDMIFSGLYLKIIKVFISKTGKVGDPPSLERVETIAEDIFVRPRLRSMQTC